VAKWDGTQALYEVTVELLDETSLPLDVWERRIGLRTLHLDCRPDKWGHAFSFHVNGRSFFAKGTHWVPADALVTRISDEKYRRVLTAAADVNMNMIRVWVWGGGIYEPDIFQTPSKIGPVDLVIVAVKTTASSHLPELLPPLLGPETAILTLQNGLGSEEFLAEHFGAERILGGLCFVCLTRRTPASVDHAGHGTLSLGEFQRPAAPRTRSLVEAFQSSGIETHLVENLAAERWRKLVWNVPFNGLAIAAGGMTTDLVLGDPRQLARCRALMEEIISIAGAVGHAIDPGYADFQIERTRSMGAYRPSTMVDWQAGQEMEIEPIWGEPLRHARALGIEVPELTRLYGEIHSRAAEI